MKIAVTTPTGHVGKAVAQALLGGGVDLRLLARHPERLEAFALRGVPIFAGGLEDPGFMVAATRGVDVLFWITPTTYDADNLRAEQNGLGRSAAKAIRANRICRVVNLSSMGAHLESAVGPINGLRDVEARLSDTGAAVTHLRPSYFFENFLLQMDAINSSGSIFLPISGSARLPMIATRDIAEVAAERLSDPSWTGVSVRELHGPADVSFDEAAAMISRAVGRPVAHFRVTPEQAHGAMRAAGLSESVSGALLQMYEAIEHGLLRPALPRSPETTTPTTLLEFARTVMHPITAEPAAL